MARRKRVSLSREVVERVRSFLDAHVIVAPEPLNTTGVRGLTREQQQESYQSWARGGRAWNALQSGGTTILAALCWYQHIHRPGSKEWRPSVIIRAVVAAASPDTRETSNGE